VLTEITGQARNMVFVAKGILALVHDPVDDEPADEGRQA